MMRIQNLQQQNKLPDINKENLPARAYNYC